MAKNGQSVGRRCSARAWDLAQAMVLGQANQLRPKATFAASRSPDTRAPEYPVLSTWQYYPLGGPAAGARLTATRSIDAPKRLFRLAPFPTPRPKYWLAAQPDARWSNW